MLDRRTLLAAAALAPMASTAEAQVQTPSARLKTVLDRFGEEALDRSPEAATAFGLDKGARARQKRQLDDRSLAGREADRTRHLDQQARLRAVPRAGLTGLDAVNYDTLAFVLDVATDADRRFPNTGGLGAPYVLSQLTGAWQSVPDFLDTQHSIATREDADAYLARLNAFAGVLDQEVEAARRDTGAGSGPPDFALDSALSQLKALRDTPAASATLVQSLVRRTRAANIGGDWEGPATAIYVSSIRPALDRQVALLTEFRKTAKPDAGVWKLPDGAEFYRLSLKAATSTTLTPAEVHKTGVELVAQINARIDTILRGQGMTSGTPGQRMHAMFSDPPFLYPNTDEGKAKLIADLNVKVRAMEAKLPQAFGVLPRAKVEIRRVPKSIEAGASSNYQAGSLDGSRPGAYYINLRDTAEVPSWALPTVTFHEAVPGHHLQISIQQEAPLPFVRQTLGFNAYVEGWALYAEQLADELGMYDADPFGRVGYLHDALLRAVRLVIDTGLHDQRWTRERAIRYFADNLGDPDSAAATEVERYAVWPGQACSYMVGKLAWLKNRERAKTALGSRFDIRRFHDVGLTSGAMPLAVLDRVVDDYIRAG